MKVFYGKTLARFNFCSDDKEWQVYLHTPFGKLSELWPRDEEPEIDDLLPTEVIDLIEKRLATYWVHTGRDEKRKVIAELRAHADEINTMWCEYGVEVARERLKQAERRLESLREDIDDAA